MRGGSLKCLGCNPGRLLFRGTCVQSITCQGSRVQSGQLRGDSCRCPDSNCHTCRIELGGSTCRTCRNGFYNWDSMCYESCPGNLVEDTRTQQYGRRCFTQAPSASPTTSDPTPAPTPSPTPNPTANPTANPTTSAPTASPTQSCQRNCGQVASGGGTCETGVNSNGDEALLCTSCNADKFLFNGRCFTKITCRARSVQSGAASGQRCRCDDRHCHYCDRTASTEVCRRCRDGWYLLNDRCTATSTLF